MKIMNNKMNNNIYDADIDNYVNTCCQEYAMSHKRPWDPHLTKAVDEVCKTLPDKVISFCNHSKTKKYNAWSKAHMRNVKITLREAFSNKKAPTLVGFQRHPDKLQFYSACQVVLPNVVSQKTAYENLAKWFSTAFFQTSAEDRSVSHSKCLLLASPCRHGTGRSRFCDFLSRWLAMHSCTADILGWHNDKYNPKFLTDSFLDPSYFRNTLTCIVGMNPPKSELKRFPLSTQLKHFLQTNIMKFNVKYAPCIWTRGLDAGNAILATTEQYDILKQGPSNIWLPVELKPCAHSLSEVDDDVYMQAIADLFTYTPEAST